MIAANNEICFTLTGEKKDLGKKRLRVGCLDEIICEAKERICLPADYIIHESTIGQRLKKKQNLMVSKIVIC